MIKLEGTMLVKAYLYQGVAYYGETRPEIWKVSEEMIVMGHPLKTWYILKDLDIEGVFDFFFDRETQEYVPEENIFYEIR